ncbi:hypothetical protein HPB51_021946 [Rhipicephalus microplus]|uniref:Uncharacterized protein n=1 Tax=Rhipicephalus microplus TaxID=6941 RepID=A0A9J6F857_RHIMP|nr:hypothetical protein HPB51_021946 [Rhipicephalus microplus]
MPKLALLSESSNCTSAHAEQQSTSRREFEDSFEKPIAEVQDEGLCSSGDEMVCDPNLLSVADSVSRDGVTLLQCYFEHDGGTEFLPGLSAMPSNYVRSLSLSWCAILAESINTMTLAINLSSDSNPASLAPPQWSSGKRTRLLIRRFRVRISAAAAAFSMEAKML